MAEIKKALTLLLIITFLCQNVAFAFSEKDSTLRPPSHFTESTEDFIRERHQDTDAEIISSSDEVLRLGNKNVRVVRLDELKAIASSIKGGVRKTGDYFEVLKIEENNNSGSEIIIYIANSETRLSEPIDRDSSWHKRQEINALLSYEDGIKALSAPERKRVILEVVTRANMVKLGHEASLKDILREFFKNSQKKFEEMAELFVLDLLKEKKPDYDVSRYVDLNLSDPEYSHITHFSWIYAVELKQLVELLRAKKGRRLAVVDNGTGFGHFILTAAYVLHRLEEKRELPPGTLERIHFIGTCHKLKDMEFAIEASFDYPGLSVSWEVLDINSLTYSEEVRKINHEKPADLIVTNHVLEHLEAKSTIDYMLDWLQIGEISVVTVPLEDSLALSISSHTNEFGEDTLEALAGQIESMTESDIKSDLNYLNGGMLVLRHENLEVVKPATEVLLEERASRILNTQL